MMRTIIVVIAVISNFRLGLSLPPSTTMSPTPLGVSCGLMNEPKRDGSAVPMVRGGQSVEGHPWPWIASIRTVDSRGEEHICAGTLIGERHILTAGHCVWDAQKNRGRGAFRDPRSLVIKMGSSHLSSTYTPSESKIFLSGVSRIHPHPKYRSPEVRAWAYDLAIIELKKRPVYVDMARHVCLPENDVAPSDGERCLVVGWGKTEDARFSYILKQAVIPIVGRRECNRPVYWRNYVDESMICAGDMHNESRASACQGDSGGPLVCLRDDDRWSVYGVVSWGPMLCGDKPGVFTNIAHVVDWISNILRLAGEPLEFPDKNRSTVKPTPSRVTLPTTQPPTHPCEATLFERKPGWIMFGPAPSHFLLSNVSEKECMEECCKRGTTECQSFVYFKTERKCRLRKVVRCSRSASFYQTRSRRLTPDVTYVGLSYCEGS